MFALYSVGQYFRTSIRISVLSVFQNQGREGWVEEEELNKSSEKGKWHPDGSSRGLSEEERQVKEMDEYAHRHKASRATVGWGRLPIAYRWHNGKGKSWLRNELKERKPWVLQSGDEGLGDNCLLAAASTMPTVSVLFPCRFYGMSGSEGTLLVGACFLWLLDFVDKLVGFYFTQLMLCNPLTELKTGLIQTNTRWCATQRHLRLRIKITMTKVWKTSCTRRNPLLCRYRGAHPGLVLTVAGRSWGATPSASFVERLVTQWKRRSMMSKKPLFLIHDTDHFCHHSCLLQPFTHTPARYRHPSALKNSAGEQFMNSSWHLCYDIWTRSSLSYI